LRERCKEGMRKKGKKRIRESALDSDPSRNNREAKGEIRYFDTVYRLHIYYLRNNYGIDKILNSKIVICYVQ
jgi:hypothetical protein